MTRRAVVMVVGALGLAALAGCSGDSGPSLDEFCEAAEDADAASDDVRELLDEGADPGELEDAYGELLDASEAALDVAPEDIADVVEQVDGGLNDAVEIWEDNDWDAAAVADDPDFQDLAEDEDTLDAQDELDGFLEDECGIEPDRPADTDAPDDTSSSDASSLGATLGAGVAAGLGVDVTPEEEQCLGEKIVEGVGLEDLMAAGQGDLSFDELDPEQQTAVFQALETCISRDTLAEALAGQLALPGVSTEQATCLAGEIVDNVGLQALGELGLSGGDPSPELLGAFQAAAAACGVDLTGGG